MRVGVFGGTFDPVHYGHLLLAESCREQCQLDQVWLMPANLPPHKRRDDLSPAKDRVAMLDLATGGQEALVVCCLEVDRGGVSYTVDTLMALHQQFPGNEWFLLLGADTLADLPNWREPARVCELALPVVVRRPGSPQPDFELLADLVPVARRQAMRSQQVEMPQIELSSTDIRQRISQQRSIRYRTPRAVEKYIETARLYQPAPG